MLDTLAKVIVVLLCDHLIAKFAVLAVPYRRRRAQLDQQDGEKCFVATVSDRLMFCDLGNRRNLGEAGTRGGR